MIISRSDLVQEVEKLLRSLSGGDFNVTGDALIFEPWKRNSIEELEKLVRSLREPHLNMAIGDARMSWPQGKQTSPIETESSRSCNTKCPHCGKSVTVTLS
jgi:hypothetical protein